MAEGSSDINVDDPDFWQKWAEKAKLDLDELANKDSLVLDTPRLRRKVNRYGNDNVEEIVDMSDAIDEVRCTYVFTFVLMVCSRQNCHCKHSTSIINKFR